MTSSRLSTYARITFVAAAAGVLAACAPVRHHPEPAPYYAPRVVYHDYWYYPAIGCYYDPRARMYLYYEHDHWVHARVLPVHVRPHLGRHVIVRSQHNRPYEAYPRHREQYTPERYRKSEKGQRHDDVWVGPPRQSNPPRDRNEPRTKRGDHDRNGKDSVRDAGPVPPQYREANSKHPRQRTESHAKETPRQRDVPVSAAPVKRDDRRRHQETPPKESREPYRSRNEQREDRRTKAVSDADADKGSQGQLSSPKQGNHRPAARSRVRNETPPQRESTVDATSAAPYQKRSPEQRKNDTRDRFSDRGDRRDSDRNGDSDYSDSLNGRWKSDKNFESYR